jgi:hypothetical protein
LLDQVIFDPRARFAQATQERRFLAEQILQRLAEPSFGWRLGGGHEGVGEEFSGEGLTIALAQFGSMFGGQFKIKGLALETEELIDGAQERRGVALVGVDCFDKVASRVTKTAHVDHASVLLPDRIQRARSIGLQKPV